MNDLLQSLKGAIARNEDHSRVARLLAAIKADNDIETEEIAVLAIRAAYYDNAAQDILVLAKEIQEEKYEWQ